MIQIHFITFCRDYISRQGYYIFRKHSFHFALVGFITYCVKSITFRVFITYCVMVLHLAAIITYFVSITWVKFLTSV